MSADVAEPLGDVSAAPPPPPPTNNTSDNNINNNMDPEQAAALAQVAIMDHSSSNNYNNNVGDQVLMGAADEDGMAAPEVVTDENGELVMQRFWQFLNAYCEQVDNDNTDSTEGQGDNNNSSSGTLYPYVEQARRIARLQLARGDDTANNEDDNDAAANPPENVLARVSAFSSTLFLNFRHVLQHDVELAEAIQSDYVRFEPFLRKALQNFLFEHHPQLDDPAIDNYYFVAVYDLPVVLSVREQLRTVHIGQLSALSGTITRTSEVRPELLLAQFRCTKCGLLTPPIPQQYHYTRPKLCRNPRCRNQSPLQFTLETAASQFCDWQKLRLQENSHEIPPGSMPRSVDVICRHEMVERVKAGDQCLLVGSLVVLPDGSALARAGEAPVVAKHNHHRASDAATGGGGGVMGLTGAKELTYRTCFVVSSVLPMTEQATKGGCWSSLLLWGKSPAALENNSSSQEPTAEEVVMQMTAEERQDIRDMRSTPNLYEQLAKSIAPSTFGHLEIKKGILLMLLGGVHKTTLTDSIKLRGDINLCVVGDPSTAKSQFLKYVHAFWPTRSVYTSGKASSAAGLTAAVQRDQDTGEYCIEAGALMLADNGICCIDEFDKMDPNDQVAIHEAMEQQTISITKAGIQATLNARASILAAANPIYGRYDRTKTLKANVALSAPILSRFDLFFVVLDECNPDSDRQVAQHILNVHRCCEEEDQSVRPPFTTAQMQRYIRFARTIHPQITAESQRVLVDCYRRLRQGDSLGRSRSAYRITVRQLESLVRLSEALARLHCDAEIRPAYVQKAFRLLRTSIIQVETADVDMEDDDDNDDDDGGGGGSGGEDGGAAIGDNGRKADMPESETPGVANDEPETQAFHPGEYDAEEVQQQSGDKRTGDTLEPSKRTKKKKKKTKISFEEYEAMANMIAAHLRSLEVETGDEDEESQTRYLKWKEVIEWYLEQVEQEIGDSVERLDEIRRKLNLVIRRLINTDNILVTVGQAPTNKREEQETLLAVHPNYVVS